jgi:hypothetical protein
VSSFRRRLTKLEGGRSGLSCLECCWPPPPGEPVEYDYVVEWGDVSDPPAPEPERCGTCGERLEIVVEWRGGPEPLEGGGGVR